MQTQIENYIAPCVGSAMCCKKAPCPYGESISKEDRGCKFLEEKETIKGVTIYQCGRYEYIRQQPGNEFCPAFGAGCCMSLFNDNRQRIIGLIRAGDIDLPHGDIQSAVS
jgi:hypothetical protein